MVSVLIDSLREDNIAEKLEVSPYYENLDSLKLMLLGA